MQPFTKVSCILAVGTMLLGNAPAQTAPAASKPHTTTAAKTGTTAAKKPATTTAPAAKAPAASTMLKTDKDKFSYAIGVSVAKTIQRQQADVDASLVSQGLKDTLSGSKTLLTDEEAQAVLMKAQTEMRAKMEQKSAEESKGNKAKGAAFLADNKKKEGVVTLPSGLQYKILKEGTGPKPAASDTVVCNYKGTLIDGKEFDASEKHGGPATFPVSGVIKGWTEALQLMPVGSMWQLYIPSDLAYGDRGAGADIQPGSTLVFDVELVSIKDKNPGAEEKKPDTGAK